MCGFILQTDSKNLMYSNVELKEIIDAPRIRLIRKS